MPEGASCSFRGQSGLMQQKSLKPSDCHWHLNIQCWPLLSRWNWYPRWWGGACELRRPLPMDVVLFSTAAARRRRSYTHDVLQQPELWVHGLSSISHTHTMSAAAYTFAVGWMRSRVTSAKSATYTVLERSMTRGSQDSGFTAHLRHVLQTHLSKPSTDSRTQQQSHDAWTAAHSTHQLRGYSKTLGQAGISFGTPRNSEKANVEMQCGEQTTFSGGRRRR